MKAVYFLKNGGPDQIVYDEIAEDLSAVPNANIKDVVKIRFLAGALNQLDIWVLKGLPHLKYKFPHICGADLCAEVVESDCPRFKVGQSVLLAPSFNLNSPLGYENKSAGFKIRGENAPGVLREYMWVNSSELIEMPSHLSPEEAAGLPLVYTTAWQMLTEKAGFWPGRFEVDESCPILVHGAGSGVTHALVDLLLSFGIQNIAVTSRDSEKLSFYKAKGISGFVAGDGLQQSLQAFTGKKGFSVIFDHVGEAYFEMNIALLSHGGRLVTCGASSGYSAKLDLRHLFFRQLQLLGSTMGTSQHFKDVIRWVAKKELRPQICRQFSLDQARLAYQHLWDGRQNGKIVLAAMN